MAALSIQVPYPVFYDRDGQPLNDGNIYIGVANLDPVTNPLQVYYDEALTITASQPLKTSGGYVYRNGTPTQLYVNANDFSITVNDSKNLLVYNFPEAGIGVGAASIEYDPPFTGAVTSGYTVSDKLSQTISVKDFGAVGDGSTDDTAAIQAALNAGRAVYFPATPNGYRISGTLTIAQPNKVVYGDSRFASYLNLASQNFNIFNVTAVGNVQIRDIGAINFGAATSGFFVNGAVPYSLEVIDCYTNNVHSGVLLGTAGSVTSGAKSAVIGCAFVDIATISGTGILMRGNGEIRDVINCQIGRLGSTVVGNNAANGVIIEGGVAINLSNLQITGAGNPLLIQPGVDNVSHVVMNGVWCDSSSGNGMFLDGNSGVITDVRMEACWFSSNGLNGIRIRGSARDIKIDGNNQIHSNGQGGIVVDNASTVPGLAIRNNSIGGNVSNGITLGSGITNFAVQNNQIGTGSVYGANANGIALTAGATNGYIITGNDLRGNTGSAYVSGATGIIARVEANLGYNPVGTFGITVGASPFTYTAGASPETVYINSGTVGLITVSGVSVLQQSNCAISLEPFQSVVVTYTVAPSMVTQVS